MSTTNTETPTIRSTYSDDQLRDALITATELRERIFIRGTVGADGAYGSQHWSENQIADLHTILNVLETLNDAEGTDAVETDERVQAWREISRHPFFESCYEEDSSLLFAMKAKLDKLTEPPTAASTDSEDSQHGVLQAASDEWEPANLETIHMTDEAVLVLYADGTGMQGTPDGIGEDDLYITVHGQQHHISRADLVEGRAWLYRIPSSHPNPDMHPVIIDSGQAWTWNAQQHMYHRPGTAEYRYPAEFANWGPASIVTLEPAEVSHG